MRTNQALLSNFYAAFARLDADTRAACYASDAVFDDKTFSLRGHAQATGMWRMLCETARFKGMGVLKLLYSGIEVNAKTGKTHLEADYRFSATSRLVHNAIGRVFKFNDQGLIARHRDSFNFWNWARQALGTPCLLPG